ncbi:MAG: sugar ABC transporter permease [Fimbriimonas sp.]|nr:sugar ABC transporter permease [Fimbriimonas sp.]
MRHGNRLAAIVLAGPAILLYGGFLVLPALLGFGYSFTNWNGWGKSPQFTGLANFKELFSDDLFYSSLRFTLTETVLTFLTFTFGAMVLAVLLDRVKLMKGLIRSLFFYPYVLSLLVGGLLFQWLSNYRDGAVNTVLRGIGLPTWAKEWMGPNWATWLLLAFVTWSALGFFTTLYLANLQTIPEDMYEASELEGAGPVSVFRHIQFPMLVPTITTNSVMSLIFGINLFGQIIVLWDKPRVDTYTVAYYIYRVGIEGNRQGYATAISLVVFIALAAIAILQVRLLRTRQVQQ